MANPERGEFELTLAGRTFTFVFKTLAVREMQEYLRAVEGRTATPAEIIQEAITHQRVLYICALLWAGLRKHHPEVTHEQIDDLFDNATPEEILAVAQLFGSSMTPDAADAAALGVASSQRPPRKRAAVTPGTGAGSTSPPDAPASGVTSSGTAP